MVIIWIVLVMVTVIGVFAAGCFMGCKIAYALMETTHKENQPIPEALTQSRSSKWEKVRIEHLKQEPKCRVCETDKDLEVHHIKPFHLYPESELDPSNLITLCRNHHYDIAHLRDWSSYNPTVKVDVSWFNYKIRHRIYGKVNWNE